MTHNSHLPVRVGKIHCQGHQDPSKRVSIFLGTHEALIKMVPIGGVPIPGRATVPRRQGGSPHSRQAGVTRRQVNRGALGPSVSDEYE